MAKKGRGKNLPRPQQQKRRPPAEESPQRRSAGPLIAGAVTLLATVGAFVFAVLSYTNDRAVATRDITPVLDFVIVRPDVKKNVPVQGQDTRGHEPLTGVLEGGSGAVDVVLNNTGGQTALIHKIDVTVKDHARLDSCTGAGGLPASASFDFRIPTKGGASGYKTSKEDLFTVEGQKPDRFLVSIGPDEISEGTWGWIYVVSVTVHVKSTKEGEPDQEIETPDVIVVDDWLAGRYDRGSLDSQSPDWKGCVREHRALVNRMVNRPEKHSAALDDLHRAIEKLGL
ncbi:hypothetical protein ACFWN2_04960 [Lentzea sp. NPDC058436]|uniref:hypothetical protein n=1 Tax=Lentzea sp. NPDC058436 TaxID=3346499 RepID=UPI00365C7BE5